VREAPSAKAGGASSLFNKVALEQEGRIDYAGSPSGAVLEISAERADLYTRRRCSVCSKEREYE